MAAVDAVRRWCLVTEPYRGDCSQLGSPRRGKSRRTYEALNFQESEAGRVLSRRSEAPRVRVLLLFLILSVAAGADNFRELLLKENPSQPATIQAVNGALQADSTQLSRPLRSAQGKGRVTPLVLALQKGDVPLVECLLSYHTPEALNAPVGVSGRPALQWLLKASHSGSDRYQLTQRLLKAGASPMAPDGLGATALHVLVASKGWEKPADFGATARALVEGGAELEAQEQRGYTPLLAAVMRHKAAVVKLLLELGADPDRVSEPLGLNARQLAEQQSDNISHPKEALEVWELLKE